ncbi:hypothetical protein CRENBAI_002324 [Crenichthys baileyi]|uniref:Uncharacterized protein n=1 Tax=Crenichthys baileyi TaxID=28760 RepID=A0AAV9RA78_9TELE
MPSIAFSNLCSKQSVGQQSMDERQGTLWADGPSVRARATQTGHNDELFCNEEWGKIHLEVCKAGRDILLKPCSCNCSKRGFYKACSQWFRIYFENHVNFPFT